MYVYLLFENTFYYKNLADNSTTHQNYQLEPAFGMEAVKPHVKLYIFNLE